MPHYCIEYKPSDVAIDDEPRPLLPMRIVEAKNESQAIAHVVENTMTVRRALPKDFMALSRAGGEIEVVK